MYFSASSKNISIYTDQNGHTFLTATCQTKDGRWVHSEIQLDGKIGYRRDYHSLSIVFFAWDRIPWPLSGQMKPGTLELRGNSLLTGTLIDDFGGHKTSLCLDFCFSNNDGTLEYDGLPGDVRQRMVKYSCAKPDTVLRGLVLREDGKLRFTDDLDLNAHYENDDGYIKQKKDGNFVMTASDWVVGQTFELATTMDCWSAGRTYREASYPLYKDIHVGNNGSIWINDPVDHGFFDLEGPFMRFLEGIPIVGYYIAEIDFLSGDEAEGVRALKECTYSTICLAASIAGATLGGPLGAALGSAISTLVAPYVQEVFPKTAAGHAFHQKVTAVSIFRVLAEEVLTIAGLGIGEISSAFGKLLADELMEQGWDSLFASMTTWLGKKALNTMTKKDMKLVVDTVVYAIEHNLGEDYIKEAFVSAADPDYDKPHYGDDDGISVGPPDYGGSDNRPGHIKVGRI